MDNNGGWSVIGHQTNLAVLDRLLNQSYLNHHAFLFYGVEHLGKTLVVEEFIKKLLQLGSNEQVWLEPDVHLLEKLPDKTEISIDQVRLWQKDLAFKPFRAAYKVGVIAGAEYLNQESSNALLKILEEPSGQTIILMLASSWRNILPTIYSRTQGLPFYSVPTKQIEDGLSRLGANQSQAKDYALKAYWRPGVAIDWLKNPDNFLAEQNRVVALEKLFGARLATLSDYLLSQKDYSTPVVQKDLSLLEQGLKKLMAKLPANKIINLMANLRWSKTLLQQNVAPQIIWEYLIMSL